MIRVSLAVILCLSACQQSGKTANNMTGPTSPTNQANAAAPAATNTSGSIPAAAQNQALSTNAAAAVPASYDWHFLAHGGSGDLDFGDGDWAEGDKLLSLSCLPGSGTVELGGGPVGLRAGGQSISIGDDSRTPVTHPVLQALRSTGNVTVASEGSERNLVAKPDGKRELERFFAYCTTPAAR